MNFQRILANAIARRIAFLIVAGLFAWIGWGDAKAQSFPHCTSENREAECPDAATAYAEVQRLLTAACAHYNSSGGDYSCTGVSPIGHQSVTNPRYFSGTIYTLHVNGFTGDGGYWTRYYANGCAAGTEWSNSQGKCIVPCSARPDSTWSGAPGIVNGSTSCKDGCTAVVMNNQDGTYTSYYGSGLSCDVPFPNGCDAAQLAAGWSNSRVTTGICVPPYQTCPTGETKNPVTGECNNDACPVGMKRNADGQCEADKPFCAAGEIRSPEGACLPGEGQCSVGEVRTPEGVCRKDSDGDGEPDDVDPDDKSSFSGGDNCDVPPTCSGDAIMCGQARIQWRIECNTRKDSNVLGGSCDAMPICTRGCENVEYQQLIQQWRASCALQRLVNGESGGGGVGGDGVLEFLQSARATDTAAANAIASGSDGLEGVSESDVWAPEGGNGTGINPGMFGGGSPTYCALTSGWDLFGHSIDPGPAFWSLASWIGWLIVASAYVWIAVKLGD